MQNFLKMSEFEIFLSKLTILVFLWNWCDMCSPLISFLHGLYRRVLAKLGIGPTRGCYQAVVGKWAYRLVTYQRVISEAYLTAGIKAEANQSFLSGASPWIWLKFSSFLLKVNLEGLRGGVRRMQTSRGQEMTGSNEV